MRFEEQSGKNILESLAPLRVALQRYNGLAWAPALAVLALVLVLSVCLPDYFKSDVSIFIQPQKITSKMIDTPEKEAEQERFEALIQEILSRPRLQKILEQFDPYPEYTGVEGREKALLKFRKAISVSPIISPSGKALTQTFQIEYNHHDAQTTFKVVQALSNLFIEESTVSAYSQTQSTEEFLESQLRSARKKLEETEKRVQQFVEENASSLPEYREQTVEQLQNARSQISQNNQTMSGNLQRISYLQQEQKLTQRETTGSMAPGSAESGDPATSLAQLEGALAVLQSRYSEKHPDVINTKKRIESMKARVGKGGGSVVSGSPEVRSIRLQIGELDAQNKAIKQQNEELQALIKRLEENIKDMPIKDRELVGIRRDYENVKRTYEELLQARESASLNTSLVRAQKGSQFKIVNPPALPIMPWGPPRLIIAGIGLAVSIVLFFAIPIGFYFINDSFKFRDEVERDLGLEVLGIIPPMKTPAAKALSRRASSTATVASAVAFLGGSLLIMFVV